MPRMARRYGSVTGEMTLCVQTRGFLGRQRILAVAGHVLDISIGGVLVSVPGNVAVQTGVRFDVTFEGERATVGVRHTEECADGRRCGLAFRSASSGFDAAVHRAIASVITDPKRNEAWRMAG